MKTPIVLSVSLVLMVILAPPVQACWGFRPMGMGGAFVAVADDANCAYWNVGGLPFMEKVEEGQMVWTSRVLDEEGLLNRQATSSNPYYDTMNFALKFGRRRKMGVSLAFASNNDSSIIRPGFGIELVRDRLGLGVSLDSWYKSLVPLESNGDLVWLDSHIWQMNLDALWRINAKWSAGVHIERFWLIDSTVRGIVGIGGEESESESVMEEPNVRPGVAYRPNEKWLINAGIYNMLGNLDEDPGFSLGAEYKVNRLWDIRGGLYNLGMEDSQMLTAGWGYKFGKDRELGGWFGMPLDDADFWSLSLGFAYGF